MRRVFDKKRASHRRERTLAWLMLAAAAPVAILSCGSASAGTDTWTGGGANGNWNNASNWGGAAPVAGDDLIFAGSTNLSTTNNFAPGTSFSSITFDTTAGAFSLANNSITLGGNITDNSAIAQAISLPISLGTTSTFVVATAGNLAISGVISGSGAQGIVQGVNQTAVDTLLTGAGTSTLTGQNTYTGATKLVSGILALDYNAAEPPTGGNTILNSASRIVTGGRGTLLMNGNASNAVVQGVNGLTVNANTNTSIIVNTPGGATTLNLGAITGASAGSVDFQNFASTTTTTTTSNGPNGILGAYYTAGTGSGAGESWAVSAASGGNPGAITPLSTFDTTFTANTDEDVSATSATPAGPLTLNSLRVSGTGALTLTLTGDTTLTTGGILNTRVQSGNGPVIAGQSGSLTSATGELVVNNRTQDNFSLNARLVGNMNLTIINQQTAGTSIDPGDTNNDNNDGSVIINSSSNSFIGTITVASGRFQITGNVGGLGNSANPIVVVGGLQGGGQFQDNNLNLDPTGTHTITVSGLGVSEDDGGSFGAVRVRNKLSSPIVLAGTTRIGVGVNAGGTFAGKISGASELWLDSDLATRPLILANSTNSWSGGTRIERGTIQMGIVNALPQNTIITFGSLIPATEFYGPEGKVGTTLNPTLNLAGFNTTIGGAQVFAGDTALTGETITNTSTTSATLTVNGTLSTTYSGTVTNSIVSTLSLVKTGSGTFTLTGNNTYVGSTSVNAGSLILTKSFVTGSDVTVTGGKLLIPSDGTNNVVLRSNTVTASGTGLIDIKDNKMITTVSPVGTWNGSAYTDVTGLIASGRNGNTLPLWDGSVGIITSTSQATTSNLHSIGIAMGSEVKPNTVSETATWGGQTITGSDTLVMYTYGGDANLDGKINIDDYVRIDQGIAGNLHGWTNGDFNYDGKINIDDYTTVIDSNVGSQTGVFPTGSSISGSGSSDVSAVPEPVALTWLLSAAPVLLCRRRRRY